MRAPWSDRLYCSHYVSQKERISEVHSDVPPERKLEQGYFRMFPWNENQNEGTFAKTTLLENRPFGSPRNALASECEYVIFTKTTGITKMTKTTQTATSKGFDWWIIRGNHGKHRNDENHGNPKPMFRKTRHLGVKLKKETNEEKHIKRFSKQSRSS